MTATRGRWHYERNESNERSPHPDDLSSSLSFLSYVQRPSWPVVMVGIVVVLELVLFVIVLALVVLRAT